MSAPVPTRKRLRVSRHAVQRYIQRVAPHMRPAVAEGVLAHLLLAGLVRVGTDPYGRGLWRLPAKPMEAEYILDEVRWKIITVLDPQDQALCRGRVSEVVSR